MFILMIKKCHFIYDWLIIVLNNAQNSHKINKVLILIHTMKDWRRISFSKIPWFHQMNIFSHFFFRSRSLVTKLWRDISILTKMINWTSKQTAPKLHQNLTKFFKNSTDQDRGSFHYELKNTLLIQSYLPLKLQKFVVNKNLSVADGHSEW